MLEGLIRDSITKANARDLKRNGYLIANIYGKGEENIHCAFKSNEFIKFMRAKTSLIFPVKLGDKSYEVVVKEYQKDPVTNNILHVDLMFAKKGVVAKFQIPVTTSGTPVGLKNKGVLVFSRRRITVKCDPAFMPNSYHFDVTALDVGDTFLVRDLQAIEGVRIMDKPSVAVVGVIKAK